MTHQPLWVILCHLPEKGRKETEKIAEETEEIVEEMKEKERKGKKKNKNENEETEEITRAGVCKTLCPQLPDSNTA